MPSATTIIFYEYFFLPKKNMIQEDEIALNCLWPSMQWKTGDYINLMKNALNFIQKRDDYRVTILFTVKPLLAEYY